MTGGVERGRNSTVCTHCHPIKQNVPKENVAVEFAGNEGGGLGHFVHFVMPQRRKLRGMPAIL